MHTLNLLRNSMRDYMEKYFLIRDQFPAMAGELLRLVTAQKRIIEKLTSQKNSKDVEALILTAAETYDVATYLLDWTKDILQGVANDAAALREGSAVRNSLNFQSAIVEEYLNRHDWEIDRIKSRQQNELTRKNTLPA